MCGIIGVLLGNPDGRVNQLIFDALTVLQHRGQDAGGMVTTSTRPRSRLNLRKENGLAREVFRFEDMLQLEGNLGIGHVRYPTAGSKSRACEAQPLYTNFPYGMCVAHNGTLTNTDELRARLSKSRRHINTDSDSELLLNVLAEELAVLVDPDSDEVSHDQIFEAVTKLISKCHGGYAVVMLILGVGLLAFRDPNGIRPLVYGSREESPQGASFAVSSESVALDALGFTVARDVAPAEAILFDYEGRVHRRVCHPSPKLWPCIFEYVYFARPDSVMNGVPVYESRRRMGTAAGRRILQLRPDHGIDVVIPIPDTSRASAIGLADALGVPCREGFIKNRYIARTFIMPGQEARTKSVRLKLNTIRSEFQDKTVLLVDDSIVRGTTSREIVAMAREAGPKQVFFVSAAPEIKFPNVYGIDIPTHTELIAHGRSVDEIQSQIGCDWLVYQTLDDLENCIRSLNPSIEGFESSCFCGSYVTPEVDDAYLSSLRDLKSQGTSALSAQNPGNCEPIHNMDGKQG
uniref:Amidophosphoribosyltransferase n=1 Tax=Rhizochromulina marina TaxID=1034831 RepID=A0A7S2SU35_9STRA|mmetsp:Transcript_7979/g.22648  ORF Transcript_7979/g.22648 Transcript_7979/m.22648 type:complete len:518 (+) Transcript_7979:79-1632(+)|eukprot:CAMPEP_0118968646 /NCGR_PEP_ID=MMETSP1173-20130426/5848_1 /TAXON_ID=1034831 /ORGANISM="Rhizochromulina marina cf, Strain CCMP1243" /LENGTH=517 /DNA_ID=CAMNT_0006917789 /DNA_START=112 /DNA_END=1665 /DNA_ORIENTATION=+